MTTRSIADPLAESYISVVHRLLDELTRVADLTAENAELKVKLAARDAHSVNVAEVMAAARITDEDLEAEALAFDLPAFPAPFPNRFPIWDKWSDVPDGVTYESIDEESISQWANSNGKRYRVAEVWQDSGIPSTQWRLSKNSEEDMSKLAPFVEVK